MSIDLEYAIKHDIRNNPVVRNVDAEQRKELLRMLGWGALVVIILMLALVPRARTVETGYEVEALKERIARAQAAQRQYRLNLEVLTRPQDVEARALAELGMVRPTEHSTIVRERRPASAPASRAIVASAR
jgi:hypothetical protein